jgi:MOSC domain-containing protein YiiM
VIIRSLNVSQTKQVQYNNKTITTGIYKQAVAGPVHVYLHQIAGDAQADLVNHGGEHKAVYAFSADHYDFWRAQRNEAIPFGKFGENLTISELSESDFCLGDHLKIGDVILESTQPRVPCFKLGMVFEDKQFPKQFIHHAETGIYFRVLETGTVKQGDEATIAYRHPDKLPMKTLFQAYFDKSIGIEESKQILNRALANEALSDEWREQLEARLAQ